MHAVAAVIPVVLVCLFINIAEMSAAPTQLADKTDEELGVLLRQPDRVRQIEALGLLGIRYRLPGEIVIRSKVSLQDAYPMDKPVSALVISNVVETARNDQDTAVRVAALDFMKVLLARTNIVSSFHEFLCDPQIAVRLRSCGAIIGHAELQGSPVPSEVVDSLIRSLGQPNDSGSLCVALSYVEQLGAQASKSMSRVSQLTKHPDKEVRAAAKAALRAMQKKPR
jgi:hypothetical protein